jgi:phosphatidylglycerophosphatase A
VKAARPTFRFLVRHPAHFLALGFGAGLAPFAPGTFGTLVAIPIARTAQ